MFPLFLMHLSKFVPPKESKNLHLWACVALRLKAGLDLTALMRREWVTVPDMWLTRGLPSAPPKACDSLGTALSEG